uniref:DUF1145 domain-containing protein n=1 Tax=Burkholderia pyrrocinia TaxID=60550 RepID=UPI0037DCDD20
MALVFPFPKPVSRFITIAVLIVQPMHSIENSLCAWFWFSLKSARINSVVWI